MALLFRVCINQHIFIECLLYTKHYTWVHKTQSLLLRYSCNGSQTIAIRIYGEVVKRSDARDLSSSYLDLLSLEWGLNIYKQTNTPPGDSNAQPTLLTYLMGEISSQWQGKNVLQVH